MMLVRFVRSIALAALLMAGVAVTGRSQSVSFSISSDPVSAGSSGSGTVSIVHSGAAPSALQWTLTYPADNIRNVVFRSALNAVNAGKSTVCSSTNGTTTCVLYGLNQGELLDGAVASFAFDSVSPTGAAVTHFQLQNVAAAGKDGESIPSDGGGISVQVTEPVSVKGVSCPSSIAAPAVITCQITLSQTARAASSISLSASSTAAILPKNLLIATGSDSVPFNAIAGAALAGSDLTITAAAGASSSDAHITVSSGGDEVILLNAASLDSILVCSPGSAVSAFGTGFTGEAAASAQAGQALPAMLAGVQVVAPAGALPLFYASSNQVNFVCPGGNADGPLQLTVETASTARDPVSIPTFLSTPGLYALDGSGKGQGAILIAGTDLVAMVATAEIPSRPARPGEYVEIYGNGFGLTDKAWPAGAPAPTDRLLRVIHPVRLVVGGMEVAPTFVGLAPGLVGLVQIDAMVPPAGVSGNAVPVYANVYLPDGSVVTSNTVTLAVEGN